MKTSKHTARLRFHREDGQAIVEFAIVLPLLVLLVFGIAQFGLAFRNYLAITDAARVAARAVAVKRTSNPCPGVAETAIRNTVSLGQWAQIKKPIGCSAGSNVGDEVKITIEYPYTFVNLIGIPDITRTLTASATERME